MWTQAAQRGMSGAPRLSRCPGEVLASIPPSDEPRGRGPARRRSSAPQACPGREGRERVSVLHLCICLSLRASSSPTHPSISPSIHPSYTSASPSSHLSIPRSCQSVRLCLLHAEQPAPGALPPDDHRPPARCCLLCQGPHGMGRPVPDTQRGASHAGTPGTSPPAPMCPVLQRCQDTWAQEKHRARGHHPHHARSGGGGHPPKTLHSSFPVPGWTSPVPNRCHPWMHPSGPGATVRGSARNLRDGGWDGCFATKALGSLMHPGFILCRLHDASPRSWFRYGTRVMHQPHSSPRGRLAPPVHRRGGIHPPAVARSHRDGLSSPGRGEPELPASRGSLSAPVPESARSRGEDAPGTQRLAKPRVGQRRPPASPLPALSQHAGSRRSAAAVSLPCSGMRPACKLHARHVHVPLSEATRPRATRARNRRRPRGTADPHGTLG